MIPQIKRMIPNSIKKSLILAYPRLFNRRTRQFEKVHGYPLNLKNPTMLPEKIRWIMINCDLSPLAPFVDKYAVREFVAERIGKQHLVPLIGVYDRFEDIDFDKLPSAFAMKATHGSGWNVVTQNKSDLDWAETGRKFNDWLGQDYYRLRGESNYKGIKPRIIIEEFLRSADGGPLKEYKFHCVEGEPVAIHLIVDRPGHKSRNYDTEWNAIKKDDPEVERQAPNTPKPHDLDKMLEICRKLTRGFPYVRLDLYRPEDGILFTEFTFTPASGMVTHRCSGVHRLVGDKFNVLKYRNRPYYVPADA